MQNRELSRIYLLEDSLNQVNPLTAKVIQAKDEAVKSQILATPNTRYIVASTCLIIVCLLVSSIFILKTYKLRLNKKLNGDQLQEIPCRRCRYFQNNSYLNCAVQPSIVLTQKAVNCPDYCSDK